MKKLFTICLVAALGLATMFTVYEVVTPGDEVSVDDQHGGFVYNVHQRHKQRRQMRHQHHHHQKVEQDEK